MEDVSNESVSEDSVYEAAISCNLEAQQSLINPDIIIWNIR
jgi:hypothetical protein